MKIIFRILLPLTMMFPNILFGQQSYDTTRHLKSPICIIKAGPLFSEFVEGEKVYYGKGIYNTTFENKYKTGFTVGTSIGYIISKHFQVSIELNYSLVKHKIKYDFHGLDSLSDESYADFQASFSVLQTSLVPRLIFGNKFKAYIELAPYISTMAAVNKKGQIDDYNYYPQAVHDNYTNNEISVRTQNVFGCFMDIGFDYPILKNDFGIEFRYYYCNHNVISTPDIKQNLVTAVLTYQFKLKNER